MKIIWLILVGIFFWKPGGVVAIESGLTVSPPFYEMVINEETETKDFTVEFGNTGKVPLTISLSVVDFGSLDESGGVAFLGFEKKAIGQNRYGLASWISLEKDMLIVSSNSSEKIKITIRNKESLSPGGHYAALVGKVESENNGQGETIGLNQALTSLIFVKKRGGEIYRLTLKELKIKQKSWIQPVLAMELRFVNEGNVHVVPRGVVEVFDPLNRMVAKGLINSESSLVLPESYRKFEIKMQQLALSLVPGKYKVVARYRFDGSEMVRNSVIEQYRWETWWVVGGLILVVGMVIVMAVRKAKKIDMK